MSFLLGGSLSKKIKIVTGALKAGLILSVFFYVGNFIVSKFIIGNWSLKSESVLKETIIVGLGSALIYVAYYIEGSRKK